MYRQWYKYKKRLTVVLFTLLITYICSLAAYSGGQDTLMQRLNGIRDELKTFGEASRLYQANDYDAAVEKLSQYLEKATQGKKPVLRGDGLAALGRIYLENGEPEKALGLLEDALKAYQEKGPPYRWGTAMVLDQLGMLYIEVGKYKEAKDKFIQAGEIYEQLGYVEGKMSALNSLASVNKLSGYPDKAVESLLKALELNKDNEPFKTVAVIHNNLASLYLDQGRLTDATTHVLQANDIFKYFGDTKGEAISIALLAKLQIAGGNLKDAKQKVLEAQELSESNSGKASLLLRSYGYFAGLDMQYEELEAVADFNKTEKNIRSHSLQIFLLPVVQPIQSTDLKWYLDFLKGQIYALQGEDEKTIDAYAQAIKTIESARLRLTVESFRTGFMENKMVVYKAMVEHLFKMKRYAASLEYAERAKSRTFLDMLGNKKFDFIEQRTFQLLKDERELQQKIGISLAKLEEEQAKPEGERSIDLKVLDQQIEKLEKSHEEILQRIRKENPRLTAFVSVDTSKPEEIQSLLDKKTALVEYFIGSGKVYVWVITKEGINAVVTNVNAETLGDKVSIFRMAISKPQISAWKDISTELYDGLIAPVEQFLVGKENIGIVPSGALHYLPFAALYGKDKVLLERFSLFTLPNAGVIKYLSHKAGKLEKLLVLGNPDLGNANYDLPAAELEAKGVAGIFPGSKLLLRNAANTGNLKMLSDTYDAIHIAAHGEFNPRRPLFSGLRLSPTDSDSNGRLEVYEVFGIKTSAKLVVLSACQTGLGKVAAGDEVVGLTQAFHYAGIPTVVSTLWNINDQATSQLMESFYRNLKTMPASVALQKAQLSVREKYPQPYFWAAFQLSGMWGSI